jgi:cysteinyl-tRNA synthetase
VAGAAGDRPVGEAPIRDVAGFAGGGGYPLTDRAHAPDAPLSPAGAAFHGRFVDALDDDLDLPAALVVVREILRSDLAPDERRWLVLDADAVLGLDLHRVWDDAEASAQEPIPAEVLALARRRETARAARDYARADALRDEIGRAGFEIVDDGATSTVRRRR